MSNRDDCRTAPAAQGLLKSLSKKSSLLPMLQAQTLPDAAPPVCKIIPFSKIAIGQVFASLLEHLHYQILCDEEV